MMPGWVVFIPIILVYCSVVATWVIRRVARLEPLPGTLHQPQPSHYTNLQPQDQVYCSDHHHHAKEKTE